MVLTGQTWGFRGNVLREDLADFITQIGYKGRPFTEITGDTEAHQDFHQWNERGLAARNINRNSQGFDYSFGDIKAPTKRTNSTQILTDSVFVSRTSARARNAGISDLIADQTNVNLIEHLNDIEWNLINGTLVSSVSGSSGVSSATGSGAQMDGLLNTLFTAGGSISALTGASLAVADLNAAQDILDSRGMEPTDILCSPVIKRRISAATTSNTKYIMASDKEVIESVAIYEGDFGRSELRVSRDLSFASGNGNNYSGFSTALPIYNTVVLDRSLWKKAWLDKTFMERVPKREDGVGMVIVSELTLEYGAKTGGHLLQNQ